MDDGFEPIVTLFLAGRLPRMNHARHIAVARILKRMRHGRELMHLGLQVTAIRHGVPDKYDRDVTDRYWDAIDGAPSLTDFDDVVSGAETR
jgi:hypothetical protein